MVAVMVVDSNVWIFGEVQDAPEHAAAVRAVTRVLPKGVAATNLIITSEVFHQLARLFGASEARRRVTNIALHPSIRWLPVSQHTVESAMAIADECKMRINDAVIAAQAIDEGASVLTDNVRDFRKVAKLKVVPLRR